MNCGQSNTASWLHDFRRLCIRLADAARLPQSHPDLTLSILRLKLRPGQLSNAGSRSKPIAYYLPPDRVFSMIALRGRC